jgi:hypothetical protein
MATRRLPHPFGQTFRMGVHAPSVPAGRPGRRKALIRACVLGCRPARERLDLLLDSHRLGSSDRDAATERAVRRHDNAVLRAGTRAPRRHVRAQLLPEVAIERARFEDLGRKGLRLMKLRAVERGVPARVLERLHVSGALLRGGQLLDRLRRGRRGAVRRAPDERDQRPDRWQHPVHEGRSYRRRAAELLLLFVAKPQFVDVRCCALRLNGVLTAF